jgi:hypothetical protein
MGRIIEKSRTVYASWPAGVASPGPGGSYCSSRQVTTVEPITSTIERGNVLLPEPSRRGSQAITEARNAVEIEPQRPARGLFARHRDLVAIRKRDPRPCECITKQVSVRAGAAWITPSETCHSQLRL